MPKEITEFVSRLLQSCLDLTQVWLVAQNRPGAAPAPRWELLAFANAETLSRLRKADALHTKDIDVMVVTDGDRFENAWGPRQLSGSLARWGWRQSAPGEAYFDEAKWLENDADGVVVRVRRKAVLLWSRATHRYG